MRANKKSSVVTAALWVLLVASASMTTPAANALRTSIFQGTWKGRGNVFKKTGEVATSYLETATFDITRHTPEFVVYRMHQDTKNAETSKPMHTETGFCKIMSDTGSATLSLAHPFPSGFVNEVSTGQLVDNQLTLTAQDFQRAVKAESMNKQVTGFKRVYTVVDGNKLHYDQYLSSGGGEMYHHLHCEMNLEK